MDSRADSKGFEQKIAADGGAGASFPLLSDPQHKVIDAYGLPDPRYLKQRREGIPYPAVYVIDRAGKVAWARVDKDYTQRPALAEIRKAIDSAK